MDANRDRTESWQRREVIGRIGPRTVERREEKPGCLLVVTPLGSWARRVERVVRGMGIVCRAAGSLEEAVAFTSSGWDGASESAGMRPDAMLIDVALPDGDGLALLDRAAEAGIATILAGKRMSLDLAECALECGACDAIDRSNISDSDLGTKVLGAILRSWNLRGRRSGQPRRMCGLKTDLDVRLNLDGTNFDVQVSDLLVTYMEMAERMNNVTTASEFKGLIRSELDIEQLLRTTLEFVLARSGPTNAAVFLPTTSGDYSLGAYVNYDCPKETCDVLLDHLANAVAPRFETVQGLVHLNDQRTMDQYIGEDADWLQGSGVIGFPCMSGGECLAIVMLFRDKRSPFQAALLEQLKTVGELFAAQLARVIHIHHRHLPKDKWSMLGDPPAETDDYGDMAA